MKSVKRAAAFQCLGYMAALLLAACGKKTPPLSPEEAVSIAVAGCDCAHCAPRAILLCCCWFVTGPAGPCIGGTGTRDRRQ